MMEPELCYTKNLIAFKCSSSVYTHQPSMETQFPCQFSHKALAGKTQWRLREECVDQAHVSEIYFLHTFHQREDHGRAGSQLNTESVRLASVQPDLSQCEHTSMIIADIIRHYRDIPGEMKLFNSIH